MLSEKEVKAALNKAKDIEKEQVMSDNEVVETYNEGIENWDEAKSLMRPSWFIKDTCKSGKKPVPRRKF